MTEEEFKPETWLFTGTRLLNGKKNHGWLPLPGTSLESEYIYPPNGTPVVGSVYKVEIRRSGDRVTKRASHTYVGRHDDDELRALAEARHKAAEAQLRLDRMERADKRYSSLDIALEPLVKLSGELPAMERTAFLAYVIQKISKPW